MHYNTAKQCNMEDTSRYKQTHKPCCLCLLYAIFTCIKYDNSFLIYHLEGGFALQSHT